MIVIITIIVLLVGITIYTLMSDNQKTYNSSWSKIKNKYAQMDNKYIYNKDGDKITNERALHLFLYNLNITPTVISYLSDTTIKSLNDLFQSCYNDNSNYLDKSVLLLNEYNDRMDKTLFSALAITFNPNDSDMINKYNYLVKLLYNKDCKYLNYAYEMFINHNQNKSIHEMLFMNISTTSVVNTSTSVVNAPTTSVVNTLLPTTSVINTPFTTSVSTTPSLLATKVTTIPLELVTPEIITTPAPEIITTPVPRIITTPAPRIITMPVPEIISTSTPLELAVPSIITTQTINTPLLTKATALLPKPLFTISKDDRYLYITINNTKDDLYFNNIKSVKIEYFYILNNIKKVVLTDPITPSILLFYTGGISLNNFPYDTTIGVEIIFIDQSDKSISNIETLSYGNPIKSS